MTGIWAEGLGTAWTPGEFLSDQYRQQLESLIQTSWFSVGANHTPYLIESMIATMEQISIQLVLRLEVPDETLKQIGQTSGF